MDKARVDEITAEYLEKIFGFALTKTMNTDRAEELASRITFDVYTSLLKADNINNVNGYIYRVACSVYARFIDEEVKGRHSSLDEVTAPCEDDFVDTLEQEETFTRLRREISYLGRLQREIVVMHYFQRLKQYEIAERLDIPLGTVKWHLHDARNQIKIRLTEGNTMREKGTLGIKPVRFTSTGHSGNPSPDGKDTSYYLAKLISQNIAYAAYHEPKNITEIAEELGVSAAYIEDEVAYLDDNGFMDKLPGGKYQTNIYISEPTKESLEEKHKIYMKYAKIVRDKYAPLVFDAMADYKSKKIYTPEDDFNFLMWLAVVYACAHKLHFSSRNSIDLSKYHVKRKDGGEYIATASIDGDFKWSELNFNSALYDVCGDMNRCGGDPYLYAWQINTYYDDRKGRWMDNLFEDYCYLYEYITGKITKDPAHIDKFKRLFDKGYLIPKGDSEYVNMVICSDTVENFIADLPSMPEEFKELSEELDEQIFKITKNTYPPHMQDLCRAWSTGRLSGNEIRMRVIELLLADGVLHSLTENQKRSVNTIMFCDMLPK